MRARSCTIPTSRRDLWLELWSTARCSKHMNVLQRLCSKLNAILGCFLHAWSHCLLQGAFMQMMCDRHVASCLWQLLGAPVWESQLSASCGAGVVRDEP